MCAICPYFFYSIPSAYGKEMPEIKSYTEEDIRRAWQNTPVDKTIDGLLSKLRGDWEDSDIITVREFREAWGRIYGHGINSDPILRDIRRHRP